MSEQPPFKVIGTRPIRHDGLDKVTGRAIYGADVQMAGLLHGRILRSPHAHAHIKGIDVSAALKLPGVEAVVTSADLPDPGSRIANLGEGAIKLRDLSSNCLAREKALYRGQAVAAVAAVNAHVAEEALKLIKVRYEPLPPVIDVRHAITAQAALLDPDLITEETLAGQPPSQAKKPSNIAKHFQFKLGEPDKAFAQAAVVVERGFQTATVHQGYIEPHNATALWNADGTVTIWCSTQGAFTVRQQVAELLGMPVSRIKVVPTEIGGGFGGKIRVYLEPVAAILSKKAGKPVKVLMSRTEVFEGTGPTPGSYIKVKLAADKNGRLTAADAYMLYEAGAYPGSPVGMGAMCIFAAYDIPNIFVDAYDVVVNKPATSAYRAPGATNAAFATETLVDEICEKLKIDPLDFRLKNGAKEGTRRADGPTFPRIGMIETVQAAQAHPHYKSPLAPNVMDKSFPRGRGVATGFWFNVGLKSSCSASVNADGTVSLVEGSTDIGGTRTSVAMQLAEALGIRAEDVRPSVADTDSVGYTDVTGGSRVTYATGWAAYEAAQDIKKQMLERVAKLWETNVEDLEYKNGGVISKKDAKKKLTFAEIAAEVQKHGGLIVGKASIDPPWPGGAFATHVVDVEVDPETGKVAVLRYTAVQDCGKAIHPSYVEGQIQGGVVQGIGWGLNEEYFYDDKGEMKNASYLDYRMPTSLDLPMIDAVIVEVPDPNHPYGVRGVGEVPIVPPPAALANAIHNAVGVRMDTLPMNPGRVVGALIGKK